jgi:putative tryptophan/tyrosine transport system substrate-binding protein
MGTASVLAAKQATSVVPIVFAGGDLVGTGLVVSLAPPGGNVTGLSLHQTDLAGKRLELLQEVVPALRRLAILGNAGNPVTLRDMREVEAAVGAPGFTVVTVEIWRVRDIAAGFEALRARADMFRPIRLLSTHHRIRRPHPRRSYWRRVHLQHAANYNAIGEHVEIVIVPFA